MLCNIEHQQRIQQNPYKHSSNILCLWEVLVVTEEEEGIPSRVLGMEVPGILKVEETSSQGIQEDSEIPMTGRLSEKSLKCTRQYATGAAKDAKFPSGQAGASRFTAVTASEKAKILNQRALIKIKKSLI